MNQERWVWNNGISELQGTVQLQTSSCKPFLRQLRSLATKLKRNVYTPSLCAVCESSQRTAGDECAFRFLRAVTSEAFGFFIGHFVDPVNPKFPQIFSSAITLDRRQALLKRIAEFLLPVIQTQLGFLREHKNALLFRQEDLQTREICDICRMAIFGASWLCSRCGSDFCPQCSAELKSNNNSAMLHCVPNSSTHSIEDFIPSSRFTEPMLNDAMQAMQVCLLRPDSVLCGPRVIFTTSDIEDSFLNSVPVRVSANRLKANSFQLFLARRIPVHIVGLNQKFQLEWSPAQLIEDFGSEECTMEDCEDPSISVKTKLKDFLGHFKEDKTTRIWKVKDWPPTAKLEDSHPPLFRDFSAAVPVREYIAQNGNLNLSAHYPVNSAVRPDLGPKVYMALASVQNDSHSGSTRLHCDLCDAANIMVYSARQAGTALWHIFKASDADKIRVYIRTTFDYTAEDPIHCQQFYLGPLHLSKLREQHGVVPFVIEQGVGEAVYIPAGCPHQVSNRAHCIKVATDFLTVEALPTCEALAKEFRQQNLRGAGKDDVLQLYSQLFYAWNSLQRPLETKRSEFNPTADSCTKPTNPSTETSPIAKSLKRRASPTLQCHLCTYSRLFFAHGLQSHMKEVHKKDEGGGATSSTPV